MSLLSGSTRPNGAISFAGSLQPKRTGVHSALRWMVIVLLNEGLSPSATPPGMTSELSDGEADIGLPYVKIAEDDEGIMQPTTAGMHHVLVLLFASGS